LGSINLISRHDAKTPFAVSMILSGSDAYLLICFTDANHPTVKTEFSALTDFSTLRKNKVTVDIHLT
jgi:hypothetical protein